MPCGYLYKIPYGYLYKILFPNTKVYIGCTTSLEDRKDSHKSCAKNNNPRCVYNALRKYNMVDTFELIKIDTAYTKKELCKKEKKYIRMYKSLIGENGYNMTDGGEGTFGYVFTEKDRQKIRDAHKRRVIEDPETYKKQGQSLKKYYEENPEAGEKHSKALKKYFEETPGAREKQSETIKKYYEENPEKREKQSEARKKYLEENPEAKQEISETKKKYYEETPEAREKILDTKGQNKPFDVFTTDGTFVKTFTYQFEAKEYLKNEYNITSNISIGLVLRGVRKSSAGFVFKYQ